MTLSTVTCCGDHGDGLVLRSGTRQLQLAWGEEMTQSSCWSCSSAKGLIMQTRCLPSTENNERTENNPSFVDADAGCCVQIQNHINPSMRSVRENTRSFFCFFYMNATQQAPRIITLPSHFLSHIFIYVHPQHIDRLLTPQLQVTVADKRLKCLQ